MALNVAEAAEKLRAKVKSVYDLLKIKLGETAAPGFRERCLINGENDRQLLFEEAQRFCAPELQEFAEACREEIARKPQWSAGAPLTADKVWLWGGPTPEWGGTLDPDTLVKQARFFNTRNGVYVYGPTTEEMIARHSSMEKLLCMVSRTCRAPGQQQETNAECAENLSRFSLKYPNVKGGMLDDMTSGSTTISPEKIADIAAISANLKKHNPALELFGVVYQHELKEKDFAPLQPYIDGVNLWFWCQEKLLDLAENVELCRQQFPGKKILLGLFLHDYGTFDGGALNELLLYQLKGARALLGEGKIDGLVILGDREILKWPEQAATVRGFLAGE